MEFINFIGLILGTLAAIFVAFYCLKDRWSSRQIVVRIGVLSVVASIGLTVMLGHYWSSTFSVTPMTEFYSMPVVSIMVSYTISILLALRDLYMDRRLVLKMVSRHCRRRV